MMVQYQKVKDQYPDAFLFYRLGDFYELFNDDAVKGAQLLELTLTSRSHSKEHPIPMCGVPYRAVESYIDILVDQGYKVAVCEQMEDPKTTKGMVKRAVTRLVTPGTALDQNGDAARENNYLTAVVAQADQFGLAYVDLATGELAVTHLKGCQAVVNELLNLRTKEVVTQADLPTAITTPLNQQHVLISNQPTLEEQAEVSYLSQDLTVPAEQTAVALLVSYLLTTQKRSLAHLQRARSYQLATYMELDPHSKANLELTANLRTHKRSGTLAWLLDETKTAMGARLLKRWLDRPLLDQAQIEQRYDRVQVLLDHYFERQNLQEELIRVYDLERLAGRVAYGSVNGRDLIQLKTSLNQVPKIKYILESLDAPAFDELAAGLDPLTDISELLERAISPEPPITVTDGGVIKDGYNHQLDDYRAAMKNGQQWIADLQQKERAATGINNLKIGYNRVFGYYIEVTKANLAKLPVDRYQRKQTLVNAERFATPELKEKEALILGAQDKSTALEYELFVKVRDQVKAAISRLQQLARQLASLDVLLSFAKVAEDYHFVRPSLNHDHQLQIKDGRHPVVEKFMGHQEYVPNDVTMDPQTSLLLITGPNMSGKSTYMRQLALTAVMAQMGSFVPASRAKLPIFDQIFTRIGAADDLVAGESTFMVEMMEANTALQHATADSLILFDELGRGTATYDGMALAQAIIEYLQAQVHAKTLFSTHYHELTSLAQSLPGLVNVHVGATEEDGELVFLHKVTAGPADKSYGVHVAKLAGLPAPLLKRAAAILAQLEQGETQLTSPAKPTTLVAPAPSAGSASRPASTASEQLALFGTPAKGAAAAPHSAAVNPDQARLAQQVAELDLMAMTPMAVMNQVYQWQQELKHGDQRRE